MIAFIYIDTTQTREFLQKKNIKFNTLNQRMTINVRKFPKIHRREILKSS